MYLVACDCFAVEQLAIIFAGWYASPKGDSIYLVTLPEELRGSAGVDDLFNRVCDELWIQILAKLA